MRYLLAALVVLALPASIWAQLPDVEMAHREALYEHHRPTHTKGGGKPGGGGGGGGPLPASWALETCYTCPLWPIDTDQNGMPMFVFGQSGDASAASKLTEQWAGSSGSGGITIQATVTMDPGAVWYGDDGDIPCAKTPHFTTYFQTADWASSGDPDDRWWTRATGASVPLVVGTHAAYAAFDPALWTNVNGKRADESPARTAAFYDSLTTADRWGGTYGCNGNYGHGIFPVGGNAWFELEQFEYVP